MTEQKDTTKVIKVTARLKKSQKVDGRWLVTYKGKQMTTKWRDIEFLVNSITEAALAFEPDEMEYFTISNKF